MSDANISMLMEMGFDVEKAHEALAVCDGNLERAIEFLFSGGGTTTMDPPPSTISTGGSTGSGRILISGPYQDIVATMSQYSVADGRSACTCIALTAAHNFLSHPSTELQPQFLELAIQQGISHYHELQQSVLGSSNGGVEHMSAEDVLNAASVGGSSTTKNPFASLQLTPGGIRQGILSMPHNNTTNSSNDMGLLALLTQCRRDDAPRDAWLAVLITKTPETVLAILPPVTASQQYMIIDSHPRPGVVVPSNGAYIRILSSLTDLVAHLTMILPATDLGPDIPEMMAIMYNSFDLYPLILQE
jgi:UBA/TS-N domain